MSRRWARWRAIRGSPGRRDGAEPSAVTLAGDRLALGGESPHGRSRLLLFVSPTCPVCKKLLPIARSFAHAERIDVLLVGDGDDAGAARDGA